MGKDAKDEAVAAIGAHDASGSDIENGLAHEVKLGRRVDEVWIIGLCRGVGVGSAGGTTGANHDAYGNGELRGESFQGVSGRGEAAIWVGAGCIEFDAGCAERLGG